MKAVCRAQSINFEVVDEETARWFRGRFGPTTEPSYTDLLIGREYEIYGVWALGGRVYYLLEGLRPESWSRFPAILFEVVDRSISKHWEIEVRSEDVVITFPVILEDKDFLLKLSESDPAVVECFKQEIARLNI